MPIISGKSPTVLERMGDSPFHFYLTGSRFFGTADERSDWDYFVDDSDEVRDFLQNLGFYDISNPPRSQHRGWDYDEGPRIPEVYDLKDVQGTNAIFEHRSGIHVQLVQDASHKNQIQVLLKGRGFPWGCKDKYILRKIWNLMFHVFSASR